MEFQVSAGIPPLLLELLLELVPLPELLELPIIFGPLLLPELTLELDDPPLPELDPVVMPEPELELLELLLLPPLELVIPPEPLLGPVGVADPELELGPPLPPDGGLVVPAVLVPVLASGAVPWVGLTDS
jgi:hypothetical protein